MSITLAVVLDTRYKKRLNKFPVKLRVTVDRISEYYQTIYNLSEDEYNKLGASRISDELTVIRKSLQSIEANANKVAEELIPFDLDWFELNYIKGNPFFIQRQKRKRKNHFVDVLESDFDFEPYEKRFRILKEEIGGTDRISTIYRNVIKELIEEERIGSGLTYQASYYSLKAFKKDVAISQITPKYLSKYERWAERDEGNSKGTIGKNLRALRFMFNEAIRKKIISKEYYPFGRGKYMIPSKKGIKTPLDITEVQKLYEYKPLEEHLRRAKAYWFFCYLGNGMNPTDLAYLKYGDINGNYLRFIRGKTKRTTKSDPKIITVFLSEVLQWLIDEWGNPEKASDNYIFALINDEQNPLQQYVRVRTLAKFIADGMYEIAKRVNIDKKPNNTTCRKTFATVMKLNGAATSLIQEQLGHSVVTTTEVYLGDYGNEIKKDFSQRLLINPAVPREEDSKYCYPMKVFSFL